MAFTQADLDELDEKIKAASVVQSDSISDRSTTFRPLKEMLELRQAIAASLAGTSRSRYAATSKGV